MIELTTKVKELLSDSKIEYYEVRSGSKESSGINVWNKDVKTLVSNNFSGLSVRILYDGAWGFYALRDNDIEKAVIMAVKFAKLNSENNKKKVKLNETKAIKKVHYIKQKKPIDDSSMEEIKEQILSMHSLEKDSKIKLNKATVNALKDTRHFINSFGSEITQTRPYAGFYVESMTSENDRSENSMDGSRSVSGLEILDKMEERFLSNNQISLDLLKSKLPKAGYHDLVCDYELAGVFVHEAIGHAAEADAVMNDQSCLKDKIGTQIGPEFVNIVNDATNINNGFYAYDDEGIIGQKVEVINNGVLNSFLHNRESSSFFDLNETGNARAENVMSVPIVRMADTHITPGDISFDEMLESVKEGYLLNGMLGGAVDTAKGTFNFTSEFGYEVENGKITNMIKSTNLSGFTLETLNNIEMVSSDKIGLSDGTCGKNGQACPVTGTHPAIKFKKVQIGGKN